VGFFGWKVVAAAFTVAVFGWGIGFYGPSVFLHALHQGRGWPVATVSAAITWHYLLSALMIARLPAVHARFGVAAVTRGGAVACALGLLAWALAAEPWQLFLAAPFTGAGWAATSGAAINAMVAPWFDRRRPAALALAYNGASVGGVVFTPVWAGLIAAYGFLVAACVVGALTVLVLWPLAGRLFGSSPASLGLHPDGAAAPPPPRPSPAAPPGGVLVRDVRFVTLAAAFSIALFAQVGLVTQLFSLLVPALGEAGAGAAISLVTVCGVAGRTALGALLRPGAGRLASALNLAVQVGGMAALLAGVPGGAVPLLLLGCALFGLGLGNLVSLPPVIAQAEFPPALVGRVVALVVATNQALYAFAPGVFGALRDAFGDAAVPVAAAACQVVAAVVVLAGRRRGGPAARR
jgi:MFS family permease